MSSSHQLATNNLISNKSSSSPSSNSSSNSPNANTKSEFYHNQSPPSIATQMSLLNELLPNIVESAANTSDLDVPTTPAYAHYCANNSAVSSQMPAELRTKLYKIFGQIEKEFDLLYSQNVKLRQELVNNGSNHNAGNNVTHTSSTSTLVANNMSKKKSSTNDLNSVLSSTSSNESSPKSTANGNSAPKKQSTRSSLSTNPAATNASTNQVFYSCI
jgi:hypothetical protein